ncbi:MAG: TerD family protein [Candidatus Sericytochromatia bacterium]|nr:TerD family protein [Candidatus Sericytochromatia bacterium]
MAISLAKGEKISLEKEAPGLKKIIVGLGWDTKKTDTGVDFDLDSSCFMLGENGKLLSDKSFIYYNNLKSPDMAVVHQGDNLTGAGDGDDEQIVIDLNNVSPDVKKIVFVVTIHDAENRKQNFGQVSNSFVRVVNADNNQEIVKYELGEDYSVETAMIMAELYRHNADWKVTAIGGGYQGGLAKILEQYQ